MESKRACQLASMMFSDTPIVVQVRSPSVVSTSTRVTAPGPPPGVEHADPVVGEVDPRQRGKWPPMALRSAASSALTGPFPSAVATTRSGPTWTLTVASVVTGAATVPSGAECRRGR